MTHAFQFTLEATQGQARAGTFVTPHGVIETPVFMPVGTHSAVRTLTGDQVAATKAQIILSNAYHLYLRPGHRLVEKAGGLHHWMNWQKPILTDSGGFQVFSLAKLRKIGETGVEFTDPLNGTKHFIGPKESMEIQ
ncbi:MAG: tRNA-guanine transglycosylase, partial [Cyanobacteria bacterium]|nr:tRNA-guanine transglycosylase [Cyanobacteriota bacterium]